MTTGPCANQTAATNTRYFPFLSSCILYLRFFFFPRRMRTGHRKAILCYLFSEVTHSEISHISSATRSTGSVQVQLPVYRGPDVATRAKCAPHPFSPSYYTGDKIINKIQYERIVQVEKWSLIVRKHTSCYDERMRSSTLSRLSLSLFFPVPLSLLNPRAGLDRTGEDPIDTITN